MDVTMLPLFVPSEHAFEVHSVLNVTEPEGNGTRLQIYVSLTGRSNRDRDMIEDY